MIRDPSKYHPVSGEQMAFERLPFNASPIEGPYNVGPVRNLGDMLVMGATIGGLLGIVIVWLLERF